MLVPLVAEGPCAQGGLGIGQRHGLLATPLLGQRHAHLEGVVGGAGVALGLVDEMGEGLVLGLCPFVLQGPLEKDAQGLLGQRLEAEERRAR